MAKMNKEGANKLFLVMLILFAAVGTILVLNRNSTSSSENIQYNLIGIAPTDISKIQNISDLEEKEIFRLENIAYSRNLTIQDTILLGAYVKNDPSLQSEFDELQWMINHSYQHHAGHSLESLLYKIKGIPYLCPSDSLSHANPYLTYNETNKAIDTVKEGEEALPAWIAQAKSIKAKYPDAYPHLDALLAVMNREISEMNLSNYTAAQADAAYLEEHGYC